MMLHWIVWTVASAQRSHSCLLGRAALLPSFRTHPVKLGAVSSPHLSDFTSVVSDDLIDMLEEQSTAVMYC